MLPSSLVGLVLFVVLLVPGFAYVLRHETRNPGLPYSAFRETLRVIFISVVCLTITGLLLAALRWLLPTRTPDVGQLLQAPDQYARNHQVQVLWWALGLLSSATLIGAFLGDPRLIERYRDLLSRPWLRWISGSLETDIRRESAWHHIFNLYAKDEPGPIHVGVQLDDGSYITGRMRNFNPGFEETQDRELVLTGPMTLTTADGETCPLSPQFTIISARRIVRMDVTHLPKNVVMQSYKTQTPSSRPRLFRRIAKAVGCSGQPES